MPGGKTPGPTGNFQLSLRNSAARGPIGMRKLSLGDYRLTPPVPLGTLMDSPPTLSLQALKQLLHNSNRDYLWKLLEGRQVPLNTLPVKAKIPCRLNPMVFTLPNEDALAILATEGLQNLSQQLNLPNISLEHMSFWMIYGNDGAPPYNPGSGSDQGKTANLNMFVTFDNNRTGLTKLGLTVIDMRTPKGRLRPGDTFSSKSQYQTGKGPYSGISSIDFEVTLKRKGHIKVDFLGAVGIDSTQWGKFVQDNIHKHISDSPLFPWPKDSIKPFAEAGIAALYKPEWVLSKNEVLGLKYSGSIQFDAKAVTGTHRTEATAGAKFILSTTAVSTALGTFHVEYSPVGGFARGFARYNDGRTDGKLGVEAGVNSHLMLNLGKIGVGLSGEVTMSTDPSLQTDNPAGSGPLLNPLTGAPKGHHGTGQVFVRWSF